MGVRLESSLSQATDEGKQASGRRPCRRVANGHPHLTVVFEDGRTQNEQTRSKSCEIGTQTLRPGPLAASGKSRKLTHLLTHRKQENSNNNQLVSNHFPHIGEYVRDLNR